MRLVDVHRSIIWVVVLVQCSVKVIGFISFGERAVNHFGRIPEPKRLVPENAWRKEYDWDYNNGNGIESNWRFVNRLLGERRPITAEQYEDDSFTLNQG